MKVIEVYYLDQRVGRLAQNGRNTAFQYDQEFIASGIELSPLKMPLKAEPYPDSGKEFEFLPALFADSLPDSYGRSLMSAWFLKHRGAIPDTLDKLAYVGEGGPGALTYRPAVDEVSAALEVFDVSRQEKLSRELIQLGRLGHETSENLEALRRQVRTVGGSYPKALFAIDPATQVLYVDHPQLLPSYEKWILKFGMPKKDRGDDLFNYPEIEFIYHQLAQESGINCPQTRLVESVQSGEKIQHFAIKRFDVEEGTRIHLATLSALIEIPASEPSIDYLDLLSATFQLTKDIKQVEEALRRMVFNVATHNYDDHAKNHSFLMRNNEWKLSPVYDITFADVPQSAGPHARAQRAMPVNRDALHPKWKDMAKVGERAGLSPSRCEAIRDEVLSAVSSLHQKLEAVGLPEKVRDRIEKQVAKVQKESFGRPVV